MKRSDIQIDKNWGHVIKELRIARGMSQGELSRRSNIDRPYLCRIESGGFRYPSYKILCKVSEGLGIPFLLVMLEIHKETWHHESLKELNKEPHTCPKCGSLIRWERQPSG